MAKSFKIRLKRSLISCTHSQKETARCLGLRGTGSSAVVVDSPAMRGQLNALNDLITDLPTAADVDYSIRAQSAQNCDGVGFLNLTASNPPTQAQVQAIANKIDELLHALKRS